MASNNDENIRQRNKDAAQRATLFWIELANQRQSEITRQLLGLSAILLPLSSSIILAPIKIGQVEKIILIHAWISLFISIIAGFIQILVDTKYFVFLSRDSSTREELWSDSNRQVQETEKDIKKLGKVPGSSSDLPLKFQALTIFIGLFLIMLMAVLLLFRK